MKWGWIEADATDSLEKKWFLVLNVLNVFFFKHSKLTDLCTGRMTMLMKARLYKTTLWLKVIESHNVLE